MVPRINKSLAIISHKYHVEAQGGYRVKGGFQALTNEVARHFESINLCVPVAKGVDDAGQPYRDNLSVTPLPAFQGREELVHELPHVMSIMWSVVRDADIVYCMGPNDVGLLAMLVAKLQKKKMFASIDTDRAGNVLTMDYHPIEKYAKYSVNRFILYPLIRFLCKDIPVFVTGDMFMGEFGAWKQWVKTTMRSREIPPKVLPEKDHDSFHIAFAGRLAPVKNLPRLVEAVDKLHLNGIPVHCTIIGDGQLKGELEQLVSTVDAQVELFGQVPNEQLIESRFLDADILVLPSLEERQGKVLLEAMACSIPVVASNAGGIPSVIEDGVNGLLCDPHSVGDIAQKIDQVKRNLCLRRELIDNGYEYAKEHALDREVSRLMTHVVKHYHLAVRS